jgi:hypothetical protein
LGKSWGLIWKRSSGGSSVGWVGSFSFMLIML